jgi:lipoyl synthase
LKTSRKPFWIRSQLAAGTAATAVSRAVEKYGLNTVCREAACPNKGECWKKNEVTFLIMGRSCTRNCRFCNVEEARTPPAVSAGEPAKIAKALMELGISYAVITSVTRDDLPDQGSGHFAKTTREIKKKTSALVELLIPDFRGRKELIARVVDSRPEVIGHNMETVERLYRKIRPGSSYKTSLATLATLKKESGNIAIKTSLMAGLGEKREELLEAAAQAKEAGVDIFYLGQYLQPGPKHSPVKKYYHPEEFRDLGKKIKNLGFSVVLSDPLVRSSYRARESFWKWKKTAGHTS